VRHNASGGGGACARRGLDLVTIYTNTSDVQENVVGVDAADLLVNAHQRCFGLGLELPFQLQQPAPGSVLVYLYR